MIVLTRGAGESIVVFHREQTCVLTLLKVDHESAVVQACHATSRRPGWLEVSTRTLRSDEQIALGESVQATLIDLRPPRVRFAVEAPKDHAVHRLEVFEEIRRKYADEDDIDPTGSASPRRDGPKPPPLDARMREPREDEMD